MWLTQLVRNHHAQHSRGDSLLMLKSQGAIPDGETTVSTVGLLNAVLGLDSSNCFVDGTVASMESSVPSNLSSMSFVAWMHLPEYIFCSFPVC